MRRLLAAVGILAIAAGTQIVGSTARPDWEWLVVADGPSGPSERQAIVRALELLPRLPARVAVIDAMEVKAKVLSRLDAFVVKDSAVVYVVRQSSLLKGAVKGSSVHVHALATVIWHEMAHVAGADEREARRQEQALWTTFVRDQRVDGTVALRYLDALSRRADDLLVASR